MTKQPLDIETDLPRGVGEGHDDHIAAPRPRSISAITRFTVLTAFILPLTLLPYLATRRQLLLLRRKVDEMTASTSALQQDLTASLSETAIRRDEHRRIRALLHEMRQEVDKLQLQAEQRESARVASDQEIRSDLRRLLDEARRTRIQATTLRALGTSLADVAAFMHEVELEQGLQTQGIDQRIERLRALALQMQNVPLQDELHGPGDESTSQLSWD